MVTKAQVQMEEQLKKQWEMLNKTFVENQQKSQEFRDRLFGGGSRNLNVEQQKQVDQITQILGMYPQLIAPVTLLLSTMVQRILTLQKAMSAHPDKTLEIMDAMENTVRGIVPEYEWPKNTDDQKLPA